MRKLHSIDFLPEDAAYSEMDSPVGRLVIITSSKGLHAILWDHDLEHESFRNMLSWITKSDNERYIVQTKNELGEYFKGLRKTFDLPLVIDGGTEFQILAWQALLKVPYACTISYAKQAEAMGDKKKARAVGMANGLNPISIVIPCHRIIGSNGKLVGFGGGLDRKEYLIALEKKYR